MLQVKCKFKDGGIQGRTYYREFTCFHLHDDTEHNVPSFITKINIHQTAKTLAVGDHLETVDGFVVPVIRAWKNFFRIAAKRSGTYSRWHVGKGQKIYFDPPPEHKLAYEYSAWGRRGRGTRLTRMQRRFCWELSKSGDAIESLKLAGYASNDAKYDQIYASKLLGMKKIQEGITDALRKRIAATSMEEAEFALLPKVRLIENLEELLRLLQRQVLGDDEKRSEYLDLFLQIADALGNNIDEMAIWMGYKGN